MNKFEKVSITEGARTELHDSLHLTGAEISVNSLPAGASVPFVHSHKQNEEIYAILEGAGKAVLDGKSIALSAGDWLRVSPSVKRRLFAAEETGIKYLCIQVKENSLEGYTAGDAII